MSPTITMCPSFQIVQNMNKEEVKKKARKNVELPFMVESSCELLHPPTKVKINGLYVLLSEIDTIMDRTCFEDLKGTMKHLMKMETNMTLSNALLFSFGQ